MKKVVLALIAAAIVAVGAGNADAAVDCSLSNRATWGPVYNPGDCNFGTVLEMGNAQFICTGPLSNYGALPILVRNTFTANPDYGDQGHLSIRSGCRGDGNDNTIDLISETNANGFTLGTCGGAGKFQTAGPVHIQVTGNFDGGRVCGLAHQDVWQFHPQWLDAHLDIINGSSGNWNAGTATVIGAGGAIFYSYPYDVDVYGGRYVTCNHGLFGDLSSANEIVDAQFRTGRVDGSDPKCQGINASPPCPTFGSSSATLVNLTCQRWNATTDQWENQAGYTGTTEPPPPPPPDPDPDPAYHPACEPTCDEQIAQLNTQLREAQDQIQSIGSLLAAINSWYEEFPG